MPHALLLFLPIAYAAVALIERQESQFGTVSLLRTESHLVLVLDDVVIGAEYTAEWARDQAAFSGMALMQGLAALTPSPRRALCLGLGAGTAPLFFREQGIETDVVERNPAVLAMAARHFLFGTRPSPGRDILADAVAFLATAPDASSGYDLVLSDLFDGNHTAFATTREHFRLLRQSWLRAGGVLAVNLVAHREGEYSKLACSVFRTLAEVFTHVRAFVDHPPSETSRLAPSNLLLCASDEPLLFSPPPDYGALAGSADFVHSNFVRWEWTAPPACGQVLSDTELPPEWLATERRAVREDMAEIQRAVLTAEGLDLLSTGVPTSDSDGNAHTPRHDGQELHALPLDRSDEKYDAEATNTCDQ